MPWVDDKTGETVSSSDLDATFKSYPVTEPSSLGTKAIKMAGKILPRAGTMTAGSEIGGALGAMTPVPGGAAIGAAVGGGLGNLAGKYLPEEIGGTPQESKKSAFLWGAGSEGLGRAAAGLKEGSAFRKGAEANYDALINKLEKPPSGIDQLSGVAQATQAPSLSRSQPLVGENLTDATHALRQSVVGEINRQRRELGAPIGDAYKALKNADEPIPEADERDLMEAAKDIRSDLISPSSPSAQRVLSRLKDTQLAGAKSALHTQGFTPEMVQDYLKAGHVMDPITYDQLRETRQIVNQRLRVSGGGDAHALLNFQQAIDEKLLPRLMQENPNITRDRQLYAGFINRFPWKDINKLNSMGTPREIGQYVFGGTPERAAELLSNAPPQARSAMREAFTERMLGGVDQNLTPEKQVDQIRKQLGPYVSNGVAAKIYGVKSAEELRNILYAPIHQQRMAKLMSEPEQKENFIKGWVSAMRDTPKDRQAQAERGLQYIVQSLPPSEQQAIMKPPMPGASLPVLPDSESSMAKGMTPPSHNDVMMNYARRRLMFAGPYSASRAVMGSPAGAAYGISSAAALATWAASSAGYRSLMQNGGAQFMAKLYASPNGRKAARAMFEMLAGIGGSAGEQVTQDTQ